MARTRGHRRGERQWGRSIRDPDRLAGSRFVDELQVADVADLAKALLLSGAAVVGRWCTRRVLPQPAVPQDSLDHVVLRWLDEADDLEASVEARTFKRIDVPDPFDQRCPAPAGKVGPRRAVVVDLQDVALLGVGFGAEATGFTGTVSLALVYLKNDKGFLEDHEIYGELEYESVTVLPDDHENDYSLSFQFSKWDDGWVEVEFKNGKPVQHSVND